MEQDNEGEGEVRDKKIRVIERFSYMARILISNQNGKINSDILLKLYVPTILYCQDTI